MESITALALTASSAFAQCGDQSFELLPSHSTYDDEYGSSIATDGILALVGVPNQIYGGTRSGTAYLFDVATGLQVDRLLESVAGYGNQFGGSIGLSGNTAAMSRPACWTWSPRASPQAVPSTSSAGSAIQQPVEQHSTFQTVSP